jgi:hypothetical protein
MTILFPTEETTLESGISAQTAVRRAGECALAMQASMSYFANIKTSQGRASLSMKVGIGLGEVLACSIGGALGRWEYVVGGDPIVQVSTAEHYAEPGQIILSPEAWARANHFFAGETKADQRGFVLLGKAKELLPPLTPIFLDWSQLDPPQRKLAEQALQCYIPGAIKARLDDPADWLAELRRITILFIGLGGIDY